MDSCNPQMLVLGGLLLVTVAGCVLLYHRAAKAEKIRDDIGHALLHWNHALRTPLTTLSGVAEMLEMSQQNMDDSQKKLVGTLKSATLSLRKIASDIADNPLVNEARDRGDD